MLKPSKWHTLTLTTILMTTGLMAFAQQPTRGRSARETARMEGDSLIIQGNVDWLQKSEIAALREGVLEKLELREGMFVKKGGVIGQLHAEVAKLSATKAKIAAESKGNLERAKASQLLAKSVIARDINLIRKNAIPTEEVEKHQAELLAADAEILRAEEDIKLNQAEHELAKRILDEHIITAPFDGIIINVMKREQESVRASEPVVTLGNPEIYRVTAFIPVDYSYKVETGQEVLVRPFVENVELPVEKNVYRGKVSFVDHEIQAVAETATRVYVEVPNVDGMLRPGLQAEMTIRLTPQVNKATSAVSSNPAAIR
ncbi:MAG: Macrolide export protein MacA [Planctomycetota bacterium]|jgi:RND family efflux transporter MFP subunit